MSVLSRERAEPVLTIAGDVSAIAANVNELLGKGRPSEAIRYAVEANRRAPSPELERLMVGWRIRAFHLTQHGGGRPDWPPQYADPFPDETGLPCVSADALTSEVLGGAIQHHGALWVRGLLSTLEAAAVKKDLDRACSARDACKAGEADAESATWYSPLPGPDGSPGNRLWVEAGDGVQTIDSPRMLFTLTDALDRRGVIDVISGFLGERPAISVQKSTLRRVHPDAGTDWHQDGAFLGADVRSVNVWLGLSDCGEDAPGLDIVGRRVPYVLQSGSHGSIFDWAVGPDLVDILARGGAPIVSPVFAAGDAVLFDHMMLHRTGIRREMTKTRWAIETWFFAPSAYPMDQGPVVV